MTLTLDVTRWLDAALRPFGRAAVVTLVIDAFGRRPVLSITVYRR